MKNRENFCSPLGTIPKGEMNSSHPSCFLPLCQNKSLGEITEIIKNHSYENVFPLQVHFHAKQTHIHMK